MVLFVFCFLLFLATDELSFLFASVCVCVCVCVVLCVVVVVVVVVYRFYRAQAILRSRANSLRSHVTQYD